MYANVYADFVVHLPSFAAAMHTPQKDRPKHVSHNRFTHTEVAQSARTGKKNEANRLAVDQNYVCGRLEDDREADFASRTSRFVTVVHTFTFGPCRWPCSLSRMPAYTARARAWADKERRYIHSLVCQCIAAERVTPQEKNVHTHLCTYTRRRMQKYVDMHKTRAERIVQGS